LSGATNTHDDLTELERIVSRLAPRWFVGKNTDASAASRSLRNPGKTEKYENAIVKKIKAERTPYECT
jgi:hypothetical protein